ncbi:MAG: GDSL-type esterase/lipase family protein [Labedaea sp.]
MTATNRTIVFTGDSITDCDRRTDPLGLGAGYVDIVASSLRERGDEARIINTGISGDRIEHLQERWQQDALDHRPDLLSIFIGVNDTLHTFFEGRPTPPDVFERRYIDVLDRAAAGIHKLIIIEPFFLDAEGSDARWCDGSPFVREDLAAKRPIVRDLAHRYGAVFVALQDAVTAAAGERGPTVVAPDGVHPSAYGHRLIPDSGSTPTTGCWALSENTSRFTTRRSRRGVAPALASAGGQRRVQPMRWPAASSLRAPARLGDIPRSSRRVEPVDGLCCHVFSLSSLLYAPTLVAVLRQAASAWPCSLRTSGAMSCRCIDPILEPAGRDNDLPPGDGGSLMSRSQLYDTIGATYAMTRRTEPRIATKVWAALGDARTVLNVGAGTGSYEPSDRDVTAVEPSAVMRAQRPAGAAACVAGVAESLPFADRSFDAAMAFATIDHWQDPIAGLREMRRVARRVVVFTKDFSALDLFWLDRDYLPERADLLVGRPPLTELARGIGARVEPVLVPWDCVDGFYEAYWRRPEAYLDEEVRCGMSIWASVGPAAEQRAVRSLRADLASGRWADSNRDLIDLDAAELGDRLLVV